MSKEIELDVIKDLKDWLIGREFDIAHDIEDFGALAEVFRYFIKRDAKE